MKLKKLIIILFAIFLFSLVISCTKDSSQQPETSNVELLELQSVACNTADLAGTCTTRLREVGIVLAKTCCSTFGKCC
jgi:hypothetical protein